MLIRLDGTPLDPKERASVFANRAVIHVANLVEYGAQEAFRKIRAECVALSIKALCDLESQGTTGALLDDFASAENEYIRAVAKTRGMWNDHRKEELHQDAIRLQVLRHVLRLELLFRLKVAETAIQHTSTLMQIEEGEAPARRLIVNKPVWPFLDKITKVLRIRRVRPNDTRTFVQPVKKKKTRKRKQKQKMLKPTLIEQAVAMETANQLSSPHSFTPEEIDEMINRTTLIQGISPEMLEEVPDVPYEPEVDHPDQPERFSYATDSTNDDGYPHEE